MSSGYEGPFVREDRVRLIGVDWGTSSLRAYLIGDLPEPLDQIESDRGVLSLGPGEHEGALAAAIGSWRAEAAEAPILLSGMIGSRQGWREAPYVSCPAGLKEAAGAILTIETESLGAVGIVPGVLDADARGGPDVMRGEETQIFGALAALGRSDGLFVLPGTHSKWAIVKAGRITSFATYMTGETFAALSNHTILGKLMSGREKDEVGFEAGVRAAAELKKPGELLHAVFMTRTLGLFERLQANQLSDYLSGLLVGAEIGAASNSGSGAPVVIGAPALARRYREAGAILGSPIETAPDHCAALGQRALMEALRGRA
jgi:2-dehydro-3-deoxygalactonokinase